MTEYAEMFGQLRARVPGVPQPAAIRATARAAMKLFRQSEAWRITDTVTLGAGERAGIWPLTDAAPVPVQVQKVITVTSPDGRLAFRSPGQLDFDDEQWRTRPGHVHGIVIGAGAAFEVVGVPTSPVTLTAEIAVRPTIAATGLPDALFEQHEERLYEGALSELYIEPQRSWTDPQMGLFHRREFEMLIEEARIEATRQTHYRGGMRYGGI